MGLPALLLTFVSPLLMILPGFYAFVAVAWGPVCVGISVFVSCLCVFVAAGLDAALVSVLGGLTPRPVFGVPTSVGYGAARGGRAALASMLSSCAPGVAIMNIDNGYGAACAAARVINAL